jgi:hypothetical protein
VSQHADVPQFGLQPAQHFDEGCLRHHPSLPLHIEDAKTSMLSSITATILGNDALLPDKTVGPSIARTDAVAAASNGRTGKSISIPVRFSPEGFH